MCTFLSVAQQHDDPVLHFYGSPIPVVEESKFLGILFDRNSVLYPILNTLLVSKSLKLDYGCIMYGSARKTYLQMLDLIHNQGLRLAL